MANIDDLLRRASIIRDEEDQGENSAMRVGGLLYDMINAIDDASKTGSSTVIGKTSVVVQPKSFSNAQDIADIFVDGVKKTITAPISTGSGVTLKQPLLAINEVGAPSRINQALVYTSNGWAYKTLQDIYNEGKDGTDTSSNFSLTVTNLLPASGNQRIATLRMTGKSDIDIYAPKATTDTSGGGDGEDTDVRGISSIQAYYLVSAQKTGITRDSDGWSTRIQVFSAAKPYLWYYSMTTYTDGTKTYTDPIIIGVYGEGGGTGGAEYDDTAIRALIAQMQSDIDALRLAIAQGIDEDSARAIKNLEDWIKKFEAGEIDLDKIYGISGWLDELNGYLQQVGLLTKDPNTGEYNAKYSEILQTYDALVGAVTDIKEIYETDEDGNIVYKTDEYGNYILDEKGNKIPVLKGFDNLEATIAARIIDGDNAIARMATEWAELNADGGLLNWMMSGFQSESDRSKYTSLAAMISAAKFDNADLSAIIETYISETGSIASSKMVADVCIYEVVEDGNGNPILDSEGKLQFIQDSDEQGRLLWLDSDGKATTQNTGNPKYKIKTRSTSGLLTYADLDNANSMLYSTLNDKYASVTTSVNGKTLDSEVKVSADKIYLDGEVHAGTTFADMVLTPILSSPTGNLRINAENIDIDGLITKLTADEAVINKLSTGVIESINGGDLIIKASNITMDGVTSFEDTIFGKDAYLTYLSTSEALINTLSTNVIESINGGDLTVKAKNIKLDADETWASIIKLKELLAGTEYVDTHTNTPMFAGTLIENNRIQIAESGGRGTTNAVVITGDGISCSHPYATNTGYTLGYGGSDFYCPVSLFKGLIFDTGSSSLNLNSKFDSSTGKYLTVDGGIQLDGNIIRTSNVGNPFQIKSDVITVASSTLNLQGKTNIAELLTDNAIIKYKLSASTIAAPLIEGSDITLQGTGNQSHLSTSGMKRITLGDSSTSTITIGSPLEDADIAINASEGNLTISGDPVINGTVHATAYNVGTKPGITCTFETKEGWTIEVTNGIVTAMS